MSFLAIVFLVIIYSVLLLVFSTIYKKHSRVIFWSGAIVLFLTMCALFATGVFKPEIGNSTHNAALLGIATLMLVISAALVILAEEPEKLLWRYWKPKLKELMKKSSSPIDIVTEEASQEMVTEPAPFDVEQESDTVPDPFPDIVPEGVIIPKEIDTPLARKVFAKAIELDLIEEDGHHYRWSERESKVLLAYMCGRIYCGDKPDYNEQKRKNYWMPGKWSVFPDTALNNLFQTKDLSISRTNRVYDAAPHKSEMIDAIIDQYKDVFPKSSLLLPKK